ncbi:MAG: NMD3-related protein [Candidatus Aenigmatarchaeota archaeon]
MREKFCPNCGKKTQRLYEGFCEDCFLLKFSFLNKLPEILEIKECKLCGKFFFKKCFPSIEDLVEFFLQDFLKEKELASISYRISGSKIYTKLITKINDLKKTEEKSIDLRIKKIICQVCSMKNSGYFQAILQVRAPKNILGKIREEIENQIIYLNQYDRLAFISSFKENENGFDVYIGSKRSAYQIARILKARFMAKIKITRKIAGKIKGKKVYRDTILISIS